MRKEDLEKYIKEDGFSLFDMNKLYPTLKEKEKELILEKYFTIKNSHEYGYFFFRNIFPDHSNPRNIHCFYLKNNIYFQTFAVKIPNLKKLTDKHMITKLSAFFRKWVHMVKDVTKEQIEKDLFTSYHAYRFFSVPYFLEEKIYQDFEIFEKEYPKSMEFRKIERKIFVKNRKHSCPLCGTICSHKDFGIIKCPNGHKFSV